MRCTEDERGVVFVYNEDGSLKMFMHRRIWDDLRKSLSLPPVEPEPIVSGGSILYGIQKRGG